MKTLKLTTLVLLLLALPAVGQTILTNTTLASAVSSANGQYVLVSSATGINAPSTSDNTKATFLYVDKELMDVRAVSSTTIQVVRGAGGTAASPHASGAVVIVIPAYLGTYIGSYGTGTPQGSCTRANELALPRINFATGAFSDCLNGQWVTGVGSGTYTAPAPIMTPMPNGGTIYTSLETNGTAFDAATSAYCSEIPLPYNKYITGLKVLMGTTAGGTEKKAVALFDGGGKLLAHSAAAGQTMGSTGSVFVSVAFSSPFFAVGPARYFGCVYSNGTSDTIRHTITGVGDIYLAGKIGSQTFGTFANITAPSTFTTATGPYFLVY